VISLVSCYKENMSATLNHLFEEALLLSPASRSNLAEKLIESIEADMDPQIESLHIQEIERRKAQVLSGNEHLLSGEEVLRSAKLLVS